MRARAVAAIALSGALAFGLTGCNIAMDVETLRPYEASDGVNLNLGDLELRNVLVVSEDGELGNLVGTAVNMTNADIDFTVQWKSGGSYHEVALTAKANGLTSFGSDTQLALSPLGVVPGGLLEAVVHIDTDQDGLSIPVIGATLAEYDGLLATPTPTPTPEPEPEVTEVPEPETTEAPTS